MEDKKGPVSVETLVRVLLFWKIIATLLPSSGLIVFTLEKKDLRKYKSRKAVME